MWSVSSDFHQNCDTPDDIAIFCTKKVHMSSSNLRPVCPTYDECNSFYPDFYHSDRWPSGYSSFQYINVLSLSITWDVESIRKFLNSFSAQKPINMIFKSMKRIFQITGRFITVSFQLMLWEVLFDILKIQLSSSHIVHCFIKQSKDL